MTHTTTDTTNADLRKLVAAQTEAIREIAAKLQRSIELTDGAVAIARERGEIIASLESDLRTWRVLFALTLGAFAFMAFAFMGVVCR